MHSILLMVPIYAISALLSLAYPAWDVELDALRSCYEAFVIYSFYKLLLNYLGPDAASQKEVLQRKPDDRWPLPFCCWVYNPRTTRFLWVCTRGVLQYVLVHPLVSMVQVLTARSTRTLWNTLALAIDMISVFFAMYYLVLFYYLVKNEVIQYRPLLKFLSVKFVVFFSFWQAVFLDAITAVGWMPSTPHLTAHSLNLHIRNTLVCVEMLVAAVTHIYCFHSDDYTPSAAVATGFRDAIIPSDIIQDTRKLMMSKMHHQHQQTALEMHQVQKSASHAAHPPHSSTLSNPSPQPTPPGQTPHHFTRFHHTRAPSSDNAPLIDRDSTLIKPSGASTLNLEMDGDLEVNEIDEDIDGVGVIRGINPKLDQG